MSRSPVHRDVLMEDWGPCVHFRWKALMQDSGPCSCLRPEMVSRWSQMNQMMREQKENFREKCTAFSAREEMFVQVYTRMVCELMSRYVEILMNRLIYMETYLQGVDRSGRSGPGNGSGLGP